MSKYGPQPLEKVQAILRRFLGKSVQVSLAPPDIINITCANPQQLPNDIKRKLLMLHAARLPDFNPSNPAFQTNFEQLANSDLIPNAIAMQINQSILAQVESFEQRLNDDFEHLKLKLKPHVRPYQTIPKPAAGEYRTLKLSPPSPTNTLKRPTTVTTQADMAREKPSVVEVLEQTLAEFKIRLQKTDLLATLNQTQPVKLALADSAQPSLVKLTVTGKENSTLFVKERKRENASSSLAISISKNANTGARTNECIRAACRLAVNLAKEGKNLSIRMKAYKDLIHGYLVEAIKERALTDPIALTLTIGGKKPKIKSPRPKPTLDAKDFY